MNYEESLDYIHSISKFGIKLGLDNIKELLYRLDNPQDKMQIIHVAGTNGKGSTVSFISQILMDAGYKTGVYTSPFIERFNERMAINGKAIEDEVLCRLVEEVKETIERMVADGHPHPSEFEVVTAIGFLYFYKNKVDVLVLEVGMGGRLDATNVVNKPICTVITPIGLDHSAYLGETVEKVAYEKAGIIKLNCPCVVHNQQNTVIEVIQNKCETMKAPIKIVCVEDKEIMSYDEKGIDFIYHSNAYHVNMLGKYQADNACVAIEVVDLLRSKGLFDITDENIKNGIKNTFWMARLEKVSNDPYIIIDGAHNMHGIKGLKKSLEELFPGKKIWGVVGILGDKAYEEMMVEVTPIFERLYLTKPNNPRALDSESLKKSIDKFAPKLTKHHDDNIKRMLKRVYEDARVMENEDVIIVCFGSLYMIGEIRSLIKSHERILLSSLISRNFDQ